MKQMYCDNIVYVVDPDAVLGELLSTLLGIHNTQVNAYADAETFQQVCYAVDMGQSCLLVEASLPGLSGLALLRWLRAQGLSLPVIVLTNRASYDLRQQALSYGATEVMEKQLVSAFLVARLAQLSSGTERFRRATNCAGVHDGKRVMFRVMRPEDAEIVQEFVRELSIRSKYLRFFSSIKELAPRMLEELTHPHYPDSYAMIATIFYAGRERQIAVAHYAPNGTDGSAEFSVMVADEWQRLGIASQLMHGLTTAAAVAGIKRFEGLVLRENNGMLKLMQKLGFITSRCEDDLTVVSVSKDLQCPTRQWATPTMTKSEHIIPA